MSGDLLFVLAVALLTWGGVFFYLLRLEKLAKNLEKQVTQLSDEAESWNAEYGKQEARDE